MAILGDNTQNGGVRLPTWAISFLVAAVLWGGATEYRIQTDSTSIGQLDTSIDRLNREIADTGQAVGRIDERLKGIKEALDEIKRSLTNRP